MLLARVYRALRPLGGASRCAFASAAGVSILRNEEIKFPTMRVVYKDPSTNENKWEILSRKDALKLAKQHSLDLILVNGKAEPPVCRLDAYGQILLEQKKKEKEKKGSQKARSLKEMYIQAGIDPHDLGIKLNKVKEFLEDGHPVKVSLLAKKSALATNLLSLDETTLKVLEAIEGDVGSVQLQANANPNAMRRDYLFNPKPKK